MSQDKKVGSDLGSALSSKKVAKAFIQALGCCLYQAWWLGIGHLFGPLPGNPIQGLNHLVGYSTVSPVFCRRKLCWKAGFPVCMKHSPQGTYGKMLKPSCRALTWLFFPSKSSKLVVRSKLSREQLALLLTAPVQDGQSKQQLGKWPWNSQAQQSQHHSSLLWFRSKHNGLRDYLL